MSKETCQNARSRMIDVGVLFNKLPTAPAPDPVVLTAQNLDRASSCTNSEFFALVVSDTPPADNQQHERAKAMARNLRNAAAGCPDPEFSL
jgi:hypothetical protein